MFTRLQVTHLHQHFDRLQYEFWDSSYKAVYGAWCIQQPEICFVFMNPTARNISAHPEREGIRAPWLWLKQTWRMFHELGFISEELLHTIQTLKSCREISFVEELYQYLSSQSVYITNLAKCTQSDAKHLKDTVFKEYLPLLREEIAYVKPKKIVTFGNQVSTILLWKSTLVGSYADTHHDILSIWGDDYSIYPCRYPVGMGYRNIHKALERLHAIKSA